jgi:hypothetical protein
MEKTVQWLKSHKLTVLLLGVIVIFLIRPTSGGLRPLLGRGMSGGETMNLAMDASAPAAMMYDDSARSSAIRPFPPVMPQESVDVNVGDRKLVRNSDVSLLVDDVRSAIDQITSFAAQNNGFMVNSSVNTPEEGGSGHVSIRVPAEKLESTLQFLRGMSVRVVSENITGTDVTDQYTNTQARLDTLSKTKATFEGMLENATTVDEILRVQQSILQVQDQIDALTGQLEYLEKTSQSSLISVYLATDELSLPYSPSEPWRPAVVFKTAVRSLMMSMRSVATAAIWVAVYSPVVIVVGIFVLIVRMLMKKKVQQ